MLDGTFSTTQRFLTIPREGCFGLSELFRGMRGMGKGERGSGRAGVFVVVVVVMWGVSIQSKKDRNLVN